MSSIINCEYYDSGKGYFCCSITSQNIPDQIQCTKSRYISQDNKIIKEVLFQNCEFTKIPQNLLSIYPYLHSMKIYRSTFEMFSKNHFVPYKNFKEMRIVNCGLEFLDDEIFESLKNLEVLDLDNNPLKIVEPSIVDGMDNLRYFSMNPRFGRFVSDQGPSLDYIKECILNDFLKKDPEIIKRYTKHLQSKVQKANFKIQQQEVQLENNQLPKSFCSDLIKFTQDETTKDFQIQIDDHQFPVHKFLLAARSPTLAEILKNNPEVENLNLVDISVEIFEKILKFLYTDELPGDDGTNFLHLFAAAGKLKIEKLKNFAALKLTDMVSSENVLEIFKIACKYDHKELKQNGFKIIKEKYPGTKFKDELIDDAEKVEKLIKFLIKMEEVEKGIEGLM